ncbi:metal-dependent hydrolase [Zhongshania aquatica]|uniref:metal-dependent hydrolase n=1 Tax=Zhongshania aquatica TaxID=2965069 RepID=UPI0022B587F5|nr:metal-dependent hydrolase [Marortus sp. BJYM1]
MKAIVQPVRRNLEFNLPKDRIGDWHAGGAHITHFFNALSIFFPDGERFFIDSVRNYRDRIQDPELKESVRGFIGQEAMHGREHEEYNDALVQKGMPADRYGRIVVRLLKLSARFTPKSAQLAVTIALEHLTAILANMVLSEPRSLEGAEPRYAAIWKWHALEETEHKAVAYDVYQKVLGGGIVGYLHRCFALITATTIFWMMVIPFHIGLVRREGQLFNLVGWFKVMNFLWGSPGMLRRTIPDWLDYFKPGFHPWDHDNAQYLDEVDSLVDEVAGYDNKVAGAAA